MLTQGKGNNLVDSTLSIGDTWWRSQSPMPRGYFPGKYAASRQVGRVGAGQLHTHCGCGEGRTCADGADLQERLAQANWAYHHGGDIPGSAEGLDYAAAMSAWERHLRAC